MEIDMRNITTSPSDLTARITASIEREFAAEESRYAARGLRTLRVTNDLTKYEEGADYYVISRDGEIKSLPASVMTKYGHPIQDVADGETITYLSDREEVTMTRIGIFNVVAVCAIPGDRYQRITFMAEREEALAA